MADSEICGTKDPTFHRILLDAHFELPLGESRVCGRTQGHSTHLGTELGRPSQSSWLPAPPLPSVLGVPPELPISLNQGPWEGGQGSPEPGTRRFCL